MELREIREVYRRMAGCYDWAELPVEMAVVSRLRRGLLSRARGRVLEVAAGTGRNLASYPRACRLAAADLSPAMLARARRRAARLGRPAMFAILDGQRLPFRDGAFDTVVTTLSTCTIPDPVGALRELSRVCRPGGAMLLLEHGRSDIGWLGRWQDRRAPSVERRTGCRWTQDPLAIVRRAGLSVRRAERSFLGIFHALEVTSS